VNIIHKTFKLKKARVLVVTIRQLGGCPCLRCLIPTARLQNLVMSRDRQQHSTLARSNASRDQSVAAARSLVYERNYGVDSTAIESLLKPESWVPNSVSMIPRLVGRICSSLARMRCQMPLVYLDSMYFMCSWLISCMSLNLGYGVCFCSIC
jgi:hypothetical protein